jgi:hypothetical protein
MTHKYIKKKSGIFMFWSAECSYLRAEGFFCSLCVLYHLYRGLWRDELHFLIQKNKINFTAVYFVQFLVIKTLDSKLDPDPYPEPDPLLGKMLDPDPH